MPDEMAPQDTEAGESDNKSEIAKFLASVNIAEHLKEDKLKWIAEQVYKGYEADLGSRRQWEQNLDDWTKLAIQVREPRTFPWVNASNVKYPLLSTAAMQFAARAYPTLVPSDGLVAKAKVIGFDPQGQKAERAERVSKHMSYQIMEKMPDWELDMDKLLIILPVVGTCFKKTYWNGLEKAIYSKLVLPKDLVVNYWATSLETAERKTERILMSKRLMQERINADIWCKVDLAKTSTTNERIDMDRTKSLVAAVEDDTSPRLVLEQHAFFDLDDDDYPEPYIVTLDFSSKQVLRIAARYDSEGVQTDAKGKIIKITPIEYYTKYGFIPNPDGGFYDLGFGLLLGTLNEAVNTVINQLIDSGTYRNLQSGFISKGLRIKMGEVRMAPGQWIAVNSTAEDLTKQIVPLPSHEPSNVLFELLGTLVQSAKELASVAEIFVGKMPGQNTPATTTMATIEQGMKVFTAIYKRIYRSLTSEFQKVFYYNRVYFDPEEETNILDTQVTQNDYDERSYDICPAADPQATTATEKITKFQNVMQLAQLGVLDPQALTIRGLKALEIPNPEELIRKGPPPPDPKVAIMQQEAQIKAQESQMKAHHDEQKMQMDMATKQQQMKMDAMAQAQEMQFKVAMAKMDMLLKQMEAQHQAAQGQQELQHTEQDHQMALRQQAEQHTAGMQQQHEAHKAKVQQTKESKPK